MNKPDAAKSPEGAAMEARLIQDDNFEDAAAEWIGMLHPASKETYKAAAIQCDVNYRRANADLFAAQTESAALHAEIAKLSEERDRLRKAYGDLGEEANSLRAELSRERERHQEARQVLQQIVDERDSELDMMTCPYDRRSMTSQAWHEGVRAMWARLDIIKKTAIELLAPQPAPEDTPEEK